jgi:hypothetical protein
MASLFTSEIKGIQAMDVQRKLTVPVDAAKHLLRLQRYRDTGKPHLSVFVGDLRIAAELLRKSARPA